MADYQFVEINNGQITAKLTYHTTPSPAVDSVTVKNGSASPLIVTIERQNGSTVSATIPAGQTQTVTPQGQFRITINADGSIDTAPNFTIAGG